MISPQPNEMQKLSIIKFCLSANDGQTALKWLETSWSDRFEHERNKFLDQTLAMLGKHTELIQLRRDIYENAPSYLNLQSLLEWLPENEKANILDRAVNMALKHDNISSAIDTLIQLDASDQASEQILQQSDRLQSIFYNHLLHWAESFTQSSHYLAAIACYGTLLEQILDAGRSKAYTHAARYYKKLAELDSRIKVYSPLEDWHSYQALLMQKHGRKASFWNRVK